MEKGFKSLAEKPYDSHYMYVETTIDHPIEKVWPHALDIGGWMSAHQLETLSGEAGKVGHFERVSPRDIGPEAGLPHYHLYGIAAIIPYKYIALEVFPERGGSYGDARQWMSFDGVLLTDLGERTKVVFLMIDAQMSKGDENYYKRREKEIDDGQALIKGYFENLRVLVENGG